MTEINQSQRYKDEVAHIRLYRKGIRMNMENMANHSTT